MNWRDLGDVKPCDALAEGSAFFEDDEAPRGATGFGIDGNVVFGYSNVVDIHVVKKWVNVVNLAVAIAGGEGPCGVC